MDLIRLILVTMLVLPLGGAIAVALLGPGRARLVRQVSLAVTLVDLVLALLVTLAFINARTPDQTDLHAHAGRIPTFQPELVPGYNPNDLHKTTWNLIDFTPQGGTAANVVLRPVQLYLGVDGLNIWLVLLTAMLMVPSVLISWNSITERVHEFHAWLLLLGFGVMGVFLAFDLVLFYVFFELTLVPLFFLIGIWGGPERRHAARKFFIFTFAGSVITLLGLLAVVAACYHNPINGQRILTFSIPELVYNFNLLVESSANDPAALRAWQNFQFWAFLAMLVGFSIKVPLFPVHTWLPLAHVEAPTAGSVLLAGVLLKMGTYGFLRLCIPLAPDAAIAVGIPLLGTLAVVGIIYGALCAFAQDDVKKMVAYSSVSHLGFCILGLFALNSAGLVGGLLQMFNHGLSTGALFLLVGMLYERYHTRMMSDYSGIARRLGLLSAAMVVTCLSSVGLPGLNGFIGEALVFFGMYQVQPWLAITASAGVILGAWYLFTMLMKVFFGPLKEPHTHDGDPHAAHAPVGDLDRREVAILAPILALCLIVGVFPQPMIDTIQPDADVVAELVRQARRREPAGPTPLAQLADEPAENLLRNEGR